MQKLETLLEWKDGTKVYEKQLLDKAAEYKEIVIFGAGIGGKQTYELLMENNLSDKVKAFSDNNPDKKGTLYLDLPVICPEEIGERYGCSLVLISSTAFNIIKKQLINIGIKENNIYYFQPAGMSLNTESDLEYIKQNLQKYEEVYALLMDEKSKKIYSNILNYRITKNILWLEKMSDLIDEEERQYFDTDILENYEFISGFVDAGAYTGDTIQKFFEYFPNWKGAYYSFEAEQEIYQTMCENISNMKQKDLIEAFNYAVWNKEGELRFDATTYGKGEGSRISEEGIVVKCCSLDEVLKDKEISFIKMDIEGAEAKALEGARDIIQRNRPILAICVYHKPEDFFEIPLLISRILEDEYEFYIRQYRYGQSETVLYAMPKKRKKILCCKRI